MKNLGISFLAMSAALIGSGCVGTDEQDLGKVKDAYLGGKPASAAVKDYIASVGKAAVLHAQRVAKEHPNGNFMISPFSYQECLGMVRLGASGGTNEELAKWLGGDPNATVTGQAAAESRASMNPLIEAGILRSANAIWVRQNEAFKSDYLDAIRTNYGGTARTFQSPSTALAEVNQFIKDGTRGRIPKMLEELDPATAALLVNAVSFKDKWETTFDKAKTSDKDFRAPDGVKKVPMMSGKQGFLGGEKEGFILASGKFKTGLGIVFGLPPSEKIQPEACFPFLVEAAKSGLKEPLAKIEIPKLKSEFSWNLKKTMMAMGVSQPFDGRARFDKMSSGSLMISEAIQKSFVEFDEEGVEAAAATVVTMTKSAAPMAQIRFIADRPFAYIIHDKDGMPLFMGVVRDPSL